MAFRLRICPQTGIRRLSRRKVSRTPRKEQTYASPMDWRLGDVSGVGRFGVTVYAVRVPRRLRSVGVFVIVVGNYFVAAFYEASGASTCNHGFQHPRRNQCAPLRRPLLTWVRKTGLRFIHEALLIYAGKAAS